MLRDVSIKIKIFLLLFCLLSITAIVTGVLVQHETRTIAEKEMYKMNSAVLRQIARNVTMLMSTVKSTSDNLANDSRLNEILSADLTRLTDTKKEQKEMDSYVSQLLADKSWSQSQFSIRYDIYVKGYNGLAYSTDASKSYELNLESDSANLQRVMDSEGQAVLVNTFEEPNGIGAYHYIFQVVREIKDLITGQPIGLLVINVSEKLLNDVYGDIIMDGRNLRIVDQAGTIVSSADKREIGKTYQNYREDLFDDTGSYLTTEIQGQEYLLITSKIENAPWYVVDQIPREMIMRPLQIVTLLLIIIFLMLIVAIMLISIVFTKMLTRPILNIRKKMAQVMQGDLSVRTPINGKDEIGQLGTSFNAMVQRTSDLIDTVKQEERLKRLAELDFLRAQINPHFIYNTLSSIRSMVAMQKNEAAEDMLYQFTKLLRNTLSRSEDFNSIGQEIEMVRLYEHLQKNRYPDGFTIIYNIDEAVERIQIPALILQPLVENAIFYGMAGEEKRCLIVITAKMQKDKLLISIQDNGPGMTMDQVENLLRKESGINRVGLKNVHERLQLIYGSGAGLSIDSTSGIGTTVTVTLSGE